MHQKPHKSKELQILQFLETRTTLTSEQLKTYHNLSKGYVGEKRFYELLKKNLSINSIVLHSLLLESNDTTFQIDCLIILQNSIYLIEVKNYEGDFYLKNKSWYALATKREVNNPLIQLERSAFLLRNLLQANGFQFKISPYIVFVNQTFTLYEAPLKFPLIFPTQVHRFIEMLNNHPSRITQTHKNMAQRLEKLHITESLYGSLPNYHLQQLQRGIFCYKCGCLMRRVAYKKLSCNKCKYTENVDSGVLRSIVEFSILFPEQNITTSSIHDWCGIIGSKERIRKILADYLFFIPNGKHSHYIFPTNQNTYKFRAQKPSRD